MHFHQHHRVGVVPGTLPTRHLVLLESETGLCYSCRELMGSSATSGERPRACRFGQKPGAGVGPWGLALPGSLLPDPLLFWTPSSILGLDCPPPFPLFFLLWAKLLAPAEVWAWHCLWLPEACLSLLGVEDRPGQESQSRRTSSCWPSLPCLARVGTAQALASRPCLHCCSCSETLGLGFLTSLGEFSKGCRSHEGSISGSS